MDFGRLGLNDSALHLPVKEGQEAGVMEAQLGWEEAPLPALVLSFVAV